MTREEFQNDIRAGIPDRLPAAKPYDKRINHAPKRKDILSDEEKTLALKNALRYFPVRHHAVLAKEFAEELLVGAGVVTVPGSAFGACGEGYLRLVFANSDENLKEAVRRIDAYVRKTYPDMK